jgi:hypothetical protein
VQGRAGRKLPNYRQLVEARQEMASAVADYRSAERRAVVIRAAAAAQSSASAGLRQGSAVLDQQSSPSPPRPPASATGFATIGWFGSAGR